MSPAYEIHELLRKAKEDLAANQYREIDRNGCSAMDLARAVDKIREGERILRKAYL